MAGADAEGAADRAARPVLVSAVKRGRAPPRALATDEETVELAGMEVTIRWRRSNRARRVSLRVETRTGGVVITLPPRATRRTGERLLEKHASWLASRIEALPQAIQFAQGAVVPLGGVPHQVEHVPAGRGGAWIEGQQIMVSGDQAFLPRRVGDFLRAEARRRLCTIAQSVARETLRPSRIAIKDTRTRWGSCTGSGTLMFNWRLVMAPYEVQHYVVAHEIAHLRHMNHGPDFWSLVRELTVHESFAEDWLRRHGASLLRVGLDARLAER